MANKRQKMCSVKKTPKNKDIGAMFRSASSQPSSSKLLLEERSTTREAIATHGAVDCDLLYRGHAEKVVNKRRDAKIVYHKTPSIARRPTRRRSPADLEDANLETLVNDSIPVDMKKGDADGLAYLDRLQVLIRPNKMPRLDDYRRLISIVRSYGLHGSPELSLRAFSLLERISALHPAVEVQDRAGGPVVVTNSLAWVPIGMVDSDSQVSPSRLTEDAYDLERAGEYLAETGLLPHLLTAVHQLAFSPSDDRISQFDCKRAFGEALLLKFLVGELMKDARARLHVFSKHEASHSRSSLLQNSLLWRLLKADINVPLKNMVRMLVELIGGPAEAAGDDMDTDEDCRAEAASKAATPESRAMGKAECASVARLLLNTILELFGTAEDASLFNAKFATRSVSTGKFINYRAELDGMLLPLLTGSGTVLPTLPQKAALLNALHPRDRLRLLGMVVAKKRVKRGGDAYEVLDSALWAVEHAPLEAERFVDFRAADALQYLADEAGKSEDLAQKVLCLRDGAPSADGLALLVASLVAAGAARLPSGPERTDELALLTALAGALTNSLLERHSKGGSGTLAQESLAGLAAANASLAVLL